MKNLVQSHEKTLICDANTGIEELTRKAPKEV